MAVSSTGGGSRIGQSIGETSVKNSKDSRDDSNKRKASNTIRSRESSLQKNMSQGQFQSPEN
jgi:hypothetical protein